MTALHALLTCLRSNNNPTLPNISYMKSSGLARSQLQQDLIQNYHHVLRSESKEDIQLILQRFNLIKLYTSHCAYVEQYRSQGNKIQTARQKVNKLLFKIFNDELRTPVSQQTITNHVKEGRHWYDILSSRETHDFGYGLVLVLPVRGYADIVRKTADPIWAFIMTRLSRISHRMVRLATSMQPLGKAIESRVMDRIVHTPMLGYELRSPTSLHELSGPEFAACLASYPELGIPETLATIVAHTRKSDPMRIVRLVRQDWANKNRRDGIAFHQRAQDLQRSVQRDVDILEREANRRLHRTAPLLLGPSQDSMQQTIAQTQYLQPHPPIVDAADEMSEEDRQVSRTFSPIQNKKKKMKE